MLYIKAILTFDISLSMLLMIVMKTWFSSTASGVYKIRSEPCLTLLWGAAKPSRNFISVCFNGGFYYSVTVYSLQAFSPPRKNIVSEVNSQILWNFWILLSTCTEYKLSAVLFQKLWIWTVLSTGPNFTSLFFHHWISRRVIILYVVCGCWENSKHLWHDLDLWMVS